jgi:hypothetical protein
MQAKTQRQSVDLSAWPDLVVVYLGFRVTRWRGVSTLLGLGPQIADVAHAKPDGLLAHEQILYGPTHIGMRQYWRDLDSLERFTKSEPHKTWWRDFLKDNGGAGFWHETYRKAGGMEAIYLDMPAPTGFGLFAPGRDPAGPFMTARGRLAAAGE